MATDREVLETFALPVPDGWYVLWCEGCLYSVSFTEADTAWAPPEVWEGVLGEAKQHDCPARAGDNG